MSSLFSTPMMPEAAAAVAVSPPAPLPPAPPPPLPTPSIPALAGVAATDPGLAARIDPAAAAENALAMRGRGIQGTIATSLAGAAEPLSTGTDFSSNALLPQRKTLLGE